MSIAIKGKNGTCPCLSCQRATPQGQFEGMLGDLISARSFPKSSSGSNRQYMGSKASQGPSRQTPKVARAMVSRTLRSLFARKGR